MGKDAKKNSQYPNVLEIYLHNHPIGAVIRLQNGRNQLLFHPDYINTPASQRYTFTLTQLQNPNYLNETRSHHHQLAPVLSNLLPEGILKDWYIHHLKITSHDEFSLLAELDVTLLEPLRQSLIMESYLIGL